MCAAGLVPGSARDERPGQRVHRVSGQAAPVARAWRRWCVRIGTQERLCGAWHVLPGCGALRSSRSAWQNLKVRQVEAAGRERLVLDLSCRRKDDGRYYVVTDRWQRFSDLVVDAATLADLGAHPARARAAASAAVRSRVLCTRLHWDVAAQQGRAPSRGSVRRRSCAAVQPEQLRDGTLPTMHLSGLPACWLRK